MRKALTILLAGALVLSLTSGASAERKKTLKEYRLGEVVIKGEREKPQVYFIIPRAKLKLNKIPPLSDNAWRVKALYINF
ncbi:MAG: hypothetical protein D6713_00045 [Deltaproteobacteria bacterium]|nr:MAG: hypothetical protein D6713_00045 [Deltaproteobacteria bacterium]